jgi:hypothetical protein
MHAFASELFLVASSFAHAFEVRCVASVAELDSAFRLAESDEVEVRLVTGTYDVGLTCSNARP